jgi:hypothetical protein
MIRGGTEFYSPPILLFCDQSVNFSNTIQNLYKLLIYNV